MQNLAIGDLVLVALDSEDSTTLDKIFDRLRESGIVFDSSRVRDSVFRFKKELAMYAQVEFRFLIDDNGRLRTDFPVKDFLRMFPRVSAHNWLADEETFLVGNPDDDGAQLQIGFDPDADESLEQVRDVLAQAGLTVSEFV